MAITLDPGHGLFHKGGTSHRRLARGRIPGMGRALRLVPVLRWVVLITSAAPLTAGGSSVAAAQDAPGYEAQWTLLGGSGPLTPQTPVGIASNVIRNTLKWQVRDYGVNFGWDAKNREVDFQFFRESGSNEPIRYGERVALWINGQATHFVNYKTRKWGINLVNMSGPSYEWEIRGGEPGVDVQYGDMVALYNHVEADYMVYCTRPRAVNIRWKRDRENPEIGCHGLWATWAKKAVSLGEKAAKLAQ